jgi:FAD/FMN-containing dehydrogenase
MVFPIRFQHSLYFLLYNAWLGAAAPNPATEEACNEIKTALPGKVRVPGERAFTTESRDYYNIGLAEHAPACMVFPTSSSEVATIIKILNAKKDVSFTVKSGGHSPNVGDATVKDGVLIAMRYLNGTVYDKEKSLAYVKPGGHWWDVMKAMEGTGQAVVAGRLGVVGIGGYLTQGGNSFLSTQYGMGADVSTDDDSMTFLN